MIQYSGCEMNYKRTLAVSALLLIFILAGLYLRTLNVIPYKFYPDAYQNLLVSMNLRTSGSVAGTLGEGGYFYPPFVAWTRPVFPLFIWALDFFFADTASAARSLTFLFGILSIPAAYVLVNSILRSPPAGVSAAALLAFSYNHTVWSGTIMTETTGVLLLIVVLTWVLGRGNPTPGKTVAYDIRTGIFLGLATMTRYEYAVLIFPVGIYILSQKNPLVKLISVVTAFLSTVGIILTVYFPVADALTGFGDQIADLITVSFLLLLATVSLLLLVRYTPKPWLRLSGTYLVILLRSLTGLAALLVTARITLLPDIGILNRYPGVVSFLVNDPLISILAPVGLYLMLGNSVYRPAGLFSLFSVLLLNIFYYRTNPAMERYITHSVPFLLIPAAFALLSLYRRKPGFNTIILSVFVLVLTVFQISKSTVGIKNDLGGVFTRTSYEEVSARKIRELYGDTNVFLIASLPEPYYTFTGLPTGSIADTAPFIWTENTLPDDRMILIIHDIPMRIIFPEFSRFLQESMSDIVDTTFYTGETFMDITTPVPETDPVTVYRTTAGLLKERTGMPR